MIAIYLGGALLAVFGGLALTTSIPRAARALGDGFALLRFREGRLAILWFAALIGAGVLEAQLDPALSARLGLDFSPRLVAIEGDLVARVQDLTPEPARRLLALHYLFVFPALLVLPLFLHGSRAAGSARIHWLRCLTALGLLAMPFYLFLPVLEPSASGLSRAQPALDALHPRITGFLRGGSAADNCLPSLHVAAQLLLLGHARRWGPTRLAPLAAAAAAATAWATLALGIHWLLDLVLAPPLAYLALRLAGPGPGSVK